MTISREQGAVPVRAVLIDSHDIFRAGVQHTLAERGEVAVVGSTDCIDTAGPLLAHTRPQVVVLGLRLHEDHLLAHVPRLRRLAPTARVLVLTRDVERRRAALLEAGASAALGKDIGGDRLVNAVVELTRGRVPSTGASPRAGAASLASRSDAQLSRLALGDRGADLGPDHARLRQLSAQERRILALIGQGMSNREIAEQMFLAEKTVRNHVTRLLAKLGVSRRTQAALIAARAGA